MDAALKAAAEINAAWVTCLDGNKIDNAACPSDEEIAEIIRKYFQQSGDQEVPQC